MLEPHRRVDQALYAVIMEAYISGVSTRKVDASVAALGSQRGISKSQVSRRGPQVIPGHHPRNYLECPICQEIDQQVQAFLNRPLRETGYAYVYLDATYLHGRLGKALQVCSRAVVVAMGVNAEGHRELPGYSCGESFAYKVGESESFWSEFIASLIATGFCEAEERGLTGVKLMINDADAGLTKAIRRQLQGCVWQRCTERCAC
jgi:putative transposase